MRLEKSGLEGYLERIVHAGALSPSLKVFTEIHLEHLGRIPFENIDARRRGGYCFEQSSLFAAALRTLGFEVEARVRPPGAASPLLRTHMTLEVAVDGPWRGRRLRPSRRRPQRWSRPVHCASEPRDDRRRQV